MAHTIAEPKALPLSREETLALLDLCLNSTLEMQPAHERALTKLGDMARSYIAEEVNAETADELEEETETAPESVHAAYDPTPVRVTFWTRASIRSRLRSLPPVPEVEAYQAEACQK